MQELMKQLNETVALAKSKAEEYTKKVLQVNKSVTENAFLSGELVKKDAQLKAEAKRLAGYGDIVALSEKNKADLAEIKKQDAELTNQRNAFVTYRDQQGKEIAESKAAVQASRDAVAKKEKLLNEGLAKLEVDRKNMRNQILEELKKKI